MAVARVKNWTAGETLTAADLNAEFNNILNNDDNLANPRAASLDMDAQELILDADQDTSITADTDDRIDFKLSGTDLVRFDGTTAASVNGFDLTAAATGNAPAITAQGGDANISINHVTKGTGVVQANGNTLGWEVITSGSVSAAASLDITDLTTVYRAYMLVFDDLLPATDAVSLVLRTSTDNGVSFESGAADYSHSRIDFATGGAVSGTGSNGTTGIILISNLSNAVGEEASGVIKILNPMGTGSKTRVRFESSYLNSGSNETTTSGGGARQVSEANDAFQLLHSAGNIATMNYTLYGLRAS